jgi:asparagine N-glycosylation enzyme membrane subunit Stt3
MTPAQTAFFVLAMLLSVTGFSLAVSVSAIPALPRFRIARRQMVLLAVASLAASVALLSWVLRG